MQQPPRWRPGLPKPALAPSLCFALLLPAQLRAAPQGYVDASSHSTLNLAVKNASASSMKGVYIPAGYTAKADGPIDLPDRFSIIGGDPRSSTVTFLNTVAADGFVARRASAIELKDFRISASASSGNTQASALIRSDQSSHVRIKGLSFLNPPGMGIYLSDCVECDIEQNVFTGGRFIKARVDGSHTTVLRNSIDGGEWYGLSVSGTNNLVAENRISNLRGKSAYGIVITELRSSVVRENVIHWVERFGIFGQGAKTQGNAVYNNTIVETGVYAGAVTNPSGTGINFVSGPSRNIVFGNELPRQQGYGVLVGGGNGTNQQADTPNNVISGNHIVGSADPGITVSGSSDTTVRKNVIAAATSVGINIGDEHDNPSDRTGRSPRALITNNVISDCMLEGIFITGVSGGNITGNVLRNNSRGASRGHVSAGIALVNWGKNGGSRNNIVSLNVSNAENSPQKYGIYIAEQQTENRIQYNILYPNRVSGVEDEATGQADVASLNQTTASAAPLKRAPPLADAGAGAGLRPGSTGILDGSRSRVLLAGGPMTYAWEQVYGVPVEIYGKTSAQATFRAPNDQTVQLLGFRLTTSNSNGSSYDEVYFAVDPWLRETGTREVEQRFR